MNKRKVRFESSLKRCEALNVSDLRRKTVPRFKVKNLHIYLISFTLPPHIYSVHVRLIQNTFGKIRVVYIKRYSAGG